jgi:2-C-methyl-D-erythritol 2,4-cyclodiphosphate synthase
MRTGFGYDVHRMVVNRPLILGGVEIPYIKGLIGHSDADVLLHAFADALLGAAALGDIGKHFPDTDPRFKDISSLILLKYVADLLREQNFEIINIDATVLLQQPKIAPYIKRMRENIAQALSIDIDRVSVKATTNEELGFIGMGEGAAAYAVASIERKQLDLNL